MKSKIALFAATLSFGLLFLAACDKKSEESTPFTLKPKLPSTPYNYSVSNGLIVDFGNTLTNSEANATVAFAGFRMNPINPQITNEGATLGRVLFYDPQLSLNNSISCASCHHQDKAFSDGAAFSTGFAGEKTSRSSMPIINSVLNNNMFWDSRSSSTLDLALRPIQNHIEMGMEEMPRLTAKLAKIDYYPALFEKAFGDRNITPERIGTALSQFVNSIVSVNSRFDEGMQNGFVSFSELEMEGMQLFNSMRTNCNRCHADNNFAAPDFKGGEYGSGGPILVDPSGNIIFGDDKKGTANNGLDINYKDEGLGEGKFRIPSLRNIALTAPYMHDGRFATLEEVIEHYDSGVKPHKHLDINLRNQTDGGPLRLNLTLREKQALIAFLHTLTDQNVTVNPKWSNPFQ